MNSLNYYFTRYKTLPPFISDAAAKASSLIIIIPCYDDAYVFETLASLSASSCASRVSDDAVEVIVHVNSGETATEETVKRNRGIFAELTARAEKGYYSGFRLHSFLTEGVERRKAGVGYARRLAMDEALRRFADNDRPDGLIVSLDADTLVADCYINALSDAYEHRREDACFTFQFRHNYDLTLYSEAEIEACRLYEMYLRYYRLALKMWSSPFAVHTIGSCFAIRASAYAQMGGMPPRQAGEDFYFLQKAAKMKPVCEIRRQIVFPAPRISNRVPFGTGPSVRNIIAHGRLLVYNFHLFMLLKSFYNTLPELRNNANAIEALPQEILQYIGKSELSNTVSECLRNTSSLAAFVKRMMNVFDAFFIVRFLNSFNVSDKFPPTEINVAAKQLLDYYHIDYQNENLFEEIERLDLSV
jgi:hypothetical protein